MSEARQLFWKELNDSIRQRPNTPLRETARADSENDSWRPQRHLTDSVGYSFNLPVRNNEIMVYLVAKRTRDRETIFEYLSEYREEVEGAFEETLEWRPSDGTYKLILRREADLENRRDEWVNYCDWLIDRAERLYFATGPYLAGFDTKK
ncbi:hypothetical protein CP556_05495 [Natrinema sp. CBA1119]|uniref:DUF4268 domain-containing protein n=1 Tax=Natrinema sp. CBA1119 TaxID=1608465 RepID=UPI000BF75A86|nr:DUF4268 domain-containing protein [Natrinema sp. CBA1119]PGF15628.1 hypothetical protein CP556_05495 [Natrinema sp. CBA1119]